MQIRGSFVQIKTGDEKADPLRAVIIDLLQVPQKLQAGFCKTPVISAMSSPRYVFAMIANCNCPSM